ncbi:MAG: hypothetical protein R3B97_12860 [Dehalococcoidia bacterium]|nr:hypothetical protein [Dehalococcoidia bacterium]MCA9831570.1 hypothetical protein [Dehalococcoidia bacterium]MCB9486941.1 hypothetical protein [Thermoflexaceae bacterium]
MTVPKPETELGFNAWVVNSESPAEDGSYVSGYFGGRPTSTGVWGFPAGYDSSNCHGAGWGLAAATHSGERPAHSTLA